MNEQVQRLPEGDYLAVQWPGRNLSGLKVWGKNVLLCVDQPSRQTAGGVLLTDDMIENKAIKAETGCIFAMGPEAFRMFDDGTKWSGDAPKVGDRVYFERFAGMLAKGVDGLMYRIMDYRHIAAGLDLENPDVKDAIAGFTANAA